MIQMKTIQRISTLLFFATTALNLVSSHSMRRARDHMIETSNNFKAACGRQEFMAGVLCGENGMLKEMQRNIRNHPNDTTFKLSQDRILLAAYEYRREWFTNLQSLSVELPQR